MAILDGDLKIMASAVMDDVPEGGGPATGIEIEDGESNNMFPDLSELDRTVGRLQVRKIFPAVRTLNTDTYSGASMIVLKPPADPLVTAVLFNTEDDFDTRQQAVGRIEAYVAQGTSYPGYLFGNQIQGQQSLSVLVREEIPLPTIGTVFLLRKNEGLVTQLDQYVRVTEVSGLVRTFADVTGEFKRRELTIGISDPLRSDFPGFLDAIRNDASISYAGRTKLYTTIVADAARYYGILPLSEEAEVGDFTFKAEGIFTSIVPSAQIETPIADARLNQQAAGLIQAGDALTQNLMLIWTTGQSMFLGGQFLPGSLSVVRAGITLTDNGGKLFNGGVEVGTVDYDNGLAVLATDVFGAGSGAHAVTYKPASKPTAVTQSIGIPVTLASRALSYVITLNPAPARRSLAVSYASGGNWYTLTEDGGGGVRGSQDGTGAGSLNYLTGTLSLTLGALPDVGSAIILQWVEQVVAPRAVAAGLVNNGKLYFPVNADGEVSEEDATETLSPNGVTITWDDGVTPKTSSDDGAGNLAGDATGKVDYARGIVYFSPNVLPATGTPATFSLGKVVRYTEPAPDPWIEVGSNWEMTLEHPPSPGSVRLYLPVRVPSYPLRNGYFNAISSVYVPLEGVIFDDGDGNLIVARQQAYYEVEFAPVVVGTVNYATGEIVVAKSTEVTASIVNQQSIYYLGGYGHFLTNGPRVSKTFSLEYNASPTTVSYSHVAPTTLEHVLSLDHMRAGATLSAAYILSGVAFNLGADRYQQKLTGELVKNASPSTGVGTEVGSVNSSTGRVTLDEWVTHASPSITNWAGVQGPPTEGANTPFTTSFVTFRTAAAPLRVASISIQGEMQDGELINVTADEAGKFDGDRVKGRVNYDSGVVELYFVQDDAYNEDVEPLDLTFLGISGVTLVNASSVLSDTLRYNAVSYAYVPLDSDIIGVDPVRLPSDGRVPIYRRGEVVVVHHTATTAPAAVANAQVVNLGRTRLARARVRGANGVLITAGFTLDLDAGTVTFTDVTGYSQPVTIEHRIEDQVLLSEVQITGDLRGTRPLTHDFPVPGSYVSSAMLVGDRHARVSTFFDQLTWANAWADSVSGAAAAGTYNTIAYPPVVTNLGAVTERWALVFTNTTSFNIVGEHVGIIGAGVLTDDVEPTNPATGTPYFHLEKEGFGSGWAAGNAIRFNTVGAMFPAWVARVTRQGPATEDDDSFEILVRGDVDAP